MLKSFVILLISLLCLPSFALNIDLLKQDAKTLFAKVSATSSIELEFQEAPSENHFRFLCEGSKTQKIYKIIVTASDREMVSTYSYGLRQLGFLFPHPRRTIFPDPIALQKNCGKSFDWKPVFKDRGFHLHTQHPSEWVDGFFQGKTKIAEDLIWWLAHNQQNLLQVQLLRTADLTGLASAIELCHDLGISFGLSTSFALIQQKSYNLIPFWKVFIHLGETEALKDSVLSLIRRFDFDFMTIELGETEFTSTDPERTLHWIQTANEELKKRHRFLMIKVHVSGDQRSEKYGNFNFLVQQASPDIGAEVHTVYFYSLNGKKAPMYGRKDFSDIRNFLLQEKDKRFVLYYPETSYFVGLDIDVPLFLTDYLKARAEDSAWLAKNKLPGQIDFTTGQELGYWLFDWNFALQSDPKCLGDADCALTLLGEDPKVWEKILDWQTEYFKNQQVIQLITPSNLMDEIPWFKPLHERVLFRDLFDHPDLVAEQVSLLKATDKHKPDLTMIKNSELKNMLMVTELRVEHSLCLRQVLIQKDNLEHCSQIRNQAQTLISEVAKQTRYPESLVFEKKSNVTSYSYGYGWPALQTYFWQREEKMVEIKKQNPFFMNLYSPWALLF